MRILFLSQRVPYPPNRGDKIASFRIVNRLRRDHQVTCFAFRHEDEDEQHAEKLRGLGFRVRLFPYRPWLGRFRALAYLLTGRPLTLAFFASRALQDAVDEIMPEIDLAFAFSGASGRFLEKHDSVPRLMHFIDLDSDKWRQYAESRRFPMSWIYRREERTLLRFETRIARSFNESIVCTRAEKELFDRRIPGAPCMVLRNGVDLEYFHPAKRAPEPGRLVFTGVMNYLPNVDGCLHFAEEVLPLVRRRHPDARFTIVGAKPEPEIAALAARDGIEVTGFVDDVRDMLGRAAVAVAPLRIARGIQNKMLEAMAMGIPVVCTTSAARGVGGESGRHYLLADDPADQADAIDSILSDPERARALSEAGRAYVERHFAWERVLARLDALIARVTAEPAQPARA